VFKARRWTNEIYSFDLDKKHPNRDWILTRILWLSGLEPGFNRLGEQDSMRRYIYIHGTNEIDKIGESHSHGCIRMLDDDLIDLFRKIRPMTPILIE
jgi:L,D-transpeptidase YbiS